MSELDTIKQQVEEKLLKQQSSKEFKDVGRVAHTRKEKSAYKLISGMILKELEQDPVMAFNMVKKENVWPEIDVNLERQRGISSGATYLKVKIREAVPTRPKDEKAKRAGYVNFLELLQNDLLNCITVKEIRDLINSYDQMPFDKILGYFIDTEFLTASPERQAEILLLYNTNPKYSYLKSAYRLVKKLVNEVFGARFANMLFNSSDASNAIYYTALDFQAISEEESKLLVHDLIQRKNTSIAADKVKIDSINHMTSSELIRELNTGWRISADNMKRYKSNPEEAREWIVGYYERRIKQKIASTDDKEKLVQPKPEDWSWFENPKERIESVKPKSPAINTKSPLTYIKRTGGYKINSITPQSIIDIFGFSAVNYGVYVDDVWSKEHTKHFLGAMSDLGEMLNINIAQMNNLGKLAIAFGAKGRPGHLAAYFPQSKDINLTKGNGDGSLAHEWGHYFDNVIVEKDLKRATNGFATQNVMPDIEIKALFDEFRTFVIKGNDLYTPRVPMLFKRKKMDSAPTYVIKQGWDYKSKTVEIKSTIEETLESVMDFAVVNQSSYSTQLRVFGYIIDAFDFNSYEIPMKLTTSYYWHKSAYNYFQYSGTNEKGRDQITTGVRTKYWIDIVELWARAWETVVLKKLMDAKRESNYLVADIPMDDVISESYHEPYPMGKELEQIESIIDRIIIAVKNKFSIGKFNPPSEIREDEYLDLSSNLKSGKTETGMVIQQVTSEEKEIIFINKDKVVDIVVESSEEPNPYIGMSLQDVEDMAYQLGITEHNEDKMRVPAQSLGVNQMMKAGHAANVILSAWLNGWDSARTVEVDREFFDKFKSEEKSEINPEEKFETTEENIPDLIDGLEVLAETMEGIEKQEIEDVIEGLKLLV